MRLQVPRRRAGYLGPVARLSTVLADESSNVAKRHIRARTSDRFAATAQQFTYAFLAPELPA